MLSTLWRMARWCLARACQVLTEEETPEQQLLHLARIGGRVIARLRQFSLLSLTHATRRCTNPAADATCASHKGILVSTSSWCRRRGVRCERARARVCTPARVVPGCRSRSDCACTKPHESGLAPTFCFADPVCDKCTFAPEWAMHNTYTCSLMCICCTDLSTARCTSLFAAKKQKNDLNFTNEKFHSCIVHIHSHRSRTLQYACRCASLLRRVRHFRMYVS